MLRVSLHNIPKWGGREKKKEKRTSDSNSSEPWDLCGDSISVYVCVDGSCYNTIDEQCAWTATVLLSVARPYVSSWIEVMICSW